MKHDVVSMRLNLLIRLVRPRAGRKLIAGALYLLLAGCVSGPEKPAASLKEKLPEQQLADFLSISCADIWSLRGIKTERNPLYWLREMDCASRLTPEAARYEARQRESDSWQTAFRQGILLANAKITPLERRDIVSQLDSFSPQIPLQVRPLYQVWRDGQTLQLQLADQRMRYSKLQQSTDAELDALRKLQQSLHGELESTTRKLENLTDIERRIYSRKPVGSALTPDSGHGAPESVAPTDSKNKE